jgi:hypothetical protein
MIIIAFSLIIGISHSVPNGRAIAIERISQRAQCDTVLSVLNSLNNESKFKAFQKKCTGFPISVVVSYYNDESDSGPLEMDSCSSSNFKVVKRKTEDATGIGLQLIFSRDGEGYEYEVQRIDLNPQSNQSSVRMSGLFRGRMFWDDGRWRTVATQENRDPEPAASDIQVR